MPPVMAAVFYGFAVIVLLASLLMILFSSDGIHHSGDVIAVAILVYWFLLPTSVIAMLFSIKMSKPRWPKVLIAFGLWIANVIASFAY